MVTFCLTLIHANNRCNLLALLMFLAVIFTLLYSNRQMSQTSIPISWGPAKPLKQFHWSSPCSTESFLISKSNSLFLSFFLIKYCNLRHAHTHMHTRCDASREVCHYHSSHMYLSVVPIHLRWQASTFFFCPF